MESEGGEVLSPPPQIRGLGRPSRGPSRGSGSLTKYLHGALGAASGSRGGLTQRPPKTCVLLCLARLNRRADERQLQADCAVASSLPRGPNRGFAVEARLIWRQRSSLFSAELDYFPISAAGGGLPK